MSPTITTEATGSSQAVPELATVELVVTGEGETARAARGRLDDLSATLRASLTETGVDADRIRRVDLEVEPTAEMFDPRTDAAYEATERLVVDCVADTAEPVVITASDAGGSVHDVEFHLGESVRRRLQDEALEAATVRAREKAERVATTEDLTVAGVRELRTLESSTGTNSIVDAAMSLGEDVAFHPSPIAVSATVEAVYELTE